jgi:hypothetical protein
MYTHHTRTRQKEKRRGVKERSNCHTRSTKEETIEEREKEEAEENVKRKRVPK